MSSVVHNWFAALGLDEDEAPHFDSDSEIRLSFYYTNYKNYQTLPICTTNMEARSKCLLLDLLSFKQNQTLRFSTWNSLKDFVIFSYTIGHSVSNSKRSINPSSLETLHEEKMTDLEQYTKWVTHTYDIQNIEDFAMVRMKKVLKISESSSHAHNHRRLIHCTILLSDRHRAVISTLY
jgi:hypothetical protein